MKQILVFYNKHGNCYFDASTPELEREAFLKAFKVGCDECFYDEIRGRHAHVKFYSAARRGDYDAAKTLLSLRRDYEYEGWTLESIE